MVFDLTWMDLKVRKDLFLTTSELKSSLFPELATLKDSTGRTESTLANMRIFVNPPSEYLGKNEVVAKGGLSPVFVEWAFFATPADLGLSTYTINKGSWVRVEDLCWILEAPTLCHVFTGKSWVDYELEVKRDSALKLRLES
jgi:hypothetical protein